MKFGTEDLDEKKPFKTQTNLKNTCLCLQF